MSATLPAPDHLPSARRAAPRTSGRRRPRTLVATAAVVLLALVGSLLGGAAPAGAAQVWVDGPIRSSVVTNCPSIILGSPYQEYGVSAFASSIVDTQAQLPKAGQPFYVRIYWLGVGHPCSGSLVYPEVAFPTGVTPAVSAAAPILCYYNGNLVTSGNCPANLGPGITPGYNTILPQPNEGWPTGKGASFELRVPVVADRPMVGVNFSARALVLDGNSSPTLALSAPITVYPAPATAPAAPARPTASAGVTSATVTWTAPADGGSPITGYTITPYRNGTAQAPVTAAASDRTRTFTGLAAGASYTFDVTARNAIGTSPRSTASAAVTPTAPPTTPTAPSAPGRPSITDAGAGTVTVAWSAPSSDGGRPITAYDVSISAAGAETSTTRVTRSPATVPVPVDRTVTVTVRATNGTPGPASSPSTPTVAPFRTVDDFVHRQHVDLALRPPTAAEASDWRSRLTSGSARPSALVTQLAVAPTWSTPVGSVTRLYRAYFLRLPDTDGLSYWVDRRRAGTSLASISASFASSPEFRRLYGSLSNRAFVELVYRNVLGRPGEESGIAYWTGQLDSRATDRGRVMIGFSESAEHTSRTAGSVATVGLFFGMLDRTPTTDEVTTWSPTAAQTPTSLVAHLLGSEAYATRT